MKIRLTRPTQIEVIRGTRGAPIPPPRKFKDKANDYKRKPKFGREWE